MAQEAPIEIGQVYTRWTIIGDSVVTSSNQRKWPCRCQCGTQRYVLERSLRSGGSTSCGCLRKERSRQARSPELTGKRFGSLTVLRKAETDGRRSRSRS